MRILVIGATGLVGGAAADALEAYGDEVLRASKSSALGVDLTDAASITALFEQVGTVDAVVSAVGSVPFKPFAELTGEDYLSAYRGKVAAQVDVVRIGTAHVADGRFTHPHHRHPRPRTDPDGCRRGPRQRGARVLRHLRRRRAAAGLRINAVSPTVLTEATGYHAFFPGFPPVSAADVGQAFVRSVHGVQTGQVFAL